MIRTDRGGWTPATVSAREGRAEPMSPTVLQAAQEPETRPRLCGVVNTRTGEPCARELADGETLCRFHKAAAASAEVRRNGHGKPTAKRGRRPGNPMKDLEAGKPHAMPDAPGNPMVPPESGKSYERTPHQAAQEPAGGCAGCHHTGEPAGAREAPTRPWGEALHGGGQVIEIPVPAESRTGLSVRVLPVGGEVDVRLWRTHRTPGRTVRPGDGLALPRETWREVAEAILEAIV